MFITGSKKLLSRTNLKISLDGFLGQLGKKCPLGKIKKVESIIKGYEDANFKITTDSDTYLLKIFSKERSNKNVESYIKVLAAAKKIGVPVPQLVFSEKGETPFILTEFFEGQDFSRRVPSLKDMLSIAHYLAKLNTLSFPVTGLYDSWGNRNLLGEYEKNKGLGTLNRGEYNLIKPVVEEFELLDFSKFSKSVIHADMQRQHVLKSRSGDYCILDFGCMRFDAKVFELSTFLAWFCFGEDTILRRDEIFKKVLAEYLSVHQLTSFELAVLPILIKAAYASYLLRSSVLIRQGDKSKETLKWFRTSRRMLDLVRV